MKRMLRIALAAAIAFVSVEMNGQNTYNVFVNDKPLSSVLGLISAQCDYNFVYNNDFIDISRSVTVEASSDSFTELLEQVFAPLGIKFTIVGKQIALSIPEPDKSAGTPQAGTTRIITGTVTDRGSDAMAGAEVVIVGSRKGTYCDVDGRYTIEVPDNPSTELSFNFIGMRQVVVAIGKRNVIDVIMDNDSNQLEQTVVTGYQTLSRERSAGAFAKVGGAEVRDQANIHGNILRALEGSVAGLNVSESADGVRYLIRGVSSINASTEPLFIVDGIAMTHEQMDKMVNPNDVESVNFLKDATATSIWGAQAANGVIVVTTKSGSGNDALKISYNGTFTFKGKPVYGYQDMMSSADFITAATEVFDPQTYKWNDINTTIYGLPGGVYRTVYPHEIPLYKYYRGEISLDERDRMLGELAATDGRSEYERYFMGNSFLTNHAVSFAGGNERSNFYASLEYQRDKGAYMDPTDDYKAFFRDIFKLSKWSTLDISLTAFHSRGEAHTATNLSSLPYVSFYDAAGSEKSLTEYIMTPEYQKQVESLTGISLQYNAVSDYLDNRTVEKTMGLNANAGLKVNLTKWINYEGRFQYSITRGGSEAFLPAGSFLVREERSQGTDVDGNQFLPSSGGHYTVADASSVSYTIRNQLNFDHSFGAAKNHSVTALAGFEMRDNLSGSHSSFMRGYDMQTMQHIIYNDYEMNTTGVAHPALPSFVSAGNNYFDPNTYTQSETEYRFVSIYANGAYTLNDKYSLNASIRVDQSNLFGSDPSVQFKPIWSVGAIWNAAKEGFMADSAFDRLNLRGSFGYAGNSPKPGEGGPYDILSSTSDPAYSRFGLGYVIKTPANAKLTWEKTRTINFGVDWAVLGNRLSGSIDIYDKNTTNLLSQTPCDPSTGFVTVLSNVGRMTNRGIEVSIEAETLRSGLFAWDTDFNFTWNRNKLVDMYVEPPTTPYLMIEYEYWKGYPYGTVFGYNWAGLDPADGMPRAYNTKGEAVRTLTDIDSAEAVPYLGTTIAPVFGALGNNFRYGRFDLNVQLIYNFGHVLRNDVGRTFSYRLGSNLHNDFARRWRSSGDELNTDVPAYYSLKNTSINELDVMYLYKYGSQNVLSASYIKLREVSLGYQLGEKACRSIYARRASLRLAATNLATIAFNGQGIDPECFSLSGGARSDKFGPVITAGLNVEF
ncbi:MAG: SusC/RagA family TonB-linked outer membrane protein [Bacteroidales bacterium]|nr:SusC/RagA family TonB-linked outer membrane protein [Bacteroidales bacterium]